jgi:CHASE3 domain sensor protein
VDETRKAWDEVGEGFAKLGRMISERYQRLNASQPTPAEEGAAAKDSIRRATEELDRAFTAFGETLRDDQAREHMRDTGRKLGDALRVTFNEVSEQIRRTVSNQSPGEPDPPADTGT